MKYSLLILLITVSLRAFAPCTEAIMIEASEPVNYYDPLIKAIIQVESSGNIYAYNADERACGPMQCRPIRIEHYNQLTGKDYRTWDVFDLTVSREIFLYFTKGRDYETVAREWNGKGKMTVEYWNKVKRYL